jgi:hypothetical protein
VTRAYLPFLLAVVVAGCGSAEPAAKNTRNELISNLSGWVVEADQNGDGRLNRSEFRALMRRDFPDNAEADRQRWGDRDFAYCDSNGDGFVEAGELTAPSLVGFDCLDTDRDGQLSSTEQDAARDATCLRSRTITE